VGGLFVAQKGRSYKKETEKSFKTIQVLGGEIIGAEGNIKKKQKKVLRQFRF